MWYFCDMKFTERSLSLCTSLPRGSVSFPEEASDLQRVLGLVRCFSFWGLRLISYWQRCNELPDLSRFPPQDQARKKPVTPVLIGDQVEQTVAKTSGVFAANLVRPWLVGLVMHEAFQSLNCVICTPLLTHPDTLTFCLLRHRFGIMPLLFLEATLF